MPAVIYRNKEGKRVPSVTTVLNQWGANKQALINWAWKQGDSGVSLYEKPEAETGTITHLMIDSDVKGQKLDLGQFPMERVKEAQKCYDNFLEWKRVHKFQPIKTEVSLISEKHQYGGTLDCVALIDDRLSITDWKTGKDVYEDHIIQLEAYAMLWKENFPDSPLSGGFHIIRTGKEIASFVHHWYGEFPNAWKVFEHLRELYDLQKLIKKLK